MPETQREFLKAQSQSLGMSEAVLDSIVEAEKKILKEASAQNRTFPYIVRIHDSHGALVSEEVTNAARRDAIIAGKPIDPPSWMLHARPNPASIVADSLTIILESGIEPIKNPLLPVEATQQAPYRIEQGYVIVRCPDGHLNRGQLAGEATSPKALVCANVRCNKRWTQILPRINGFEEVEP